MENKNYKLDLLEEKVRNKLKRVRSGGYKTKKEEGYEEAILSVLSMIKEVKES